MSKIIFLFSFFLSVSVFACKCEPFNIEQSFENADIVFTGNIISVRQTPSEFKNLQNFISSVKVEKVFKSDQFEGFYQDQATLFSSQIASCDYPFNKEGKYLIFGFIDSDTGFIRSHICLATKALNQINSDNLKQLDHLSENFKQKLKKRDRETIVVRPFIEDNPDRIISDLKLEISHQKLENKKWKTMALLLASAFILSIIILVLKRLYYKK